MLDAIDTYHLLPKELESLTLLHGLRGSLYVLEQHVSLSSHLRRLDSIDVYHWAVRGEEHVQCALEVVFLELVRQVMEVERLVRRHALFRKSL